MMQKYLQGYLSYIILAFMVLRGEGIYALTIESKFSYLPVISNANSILYFDVSSLRNSYLKNLISKANIAYFNITDSNRYEKLINNISELLVSFDISGIKMIDESNEVRGIKILGVIAFREEVNIDTLREILSSFIPASLRNVMAEQVIMNRELIAVSIGSKDRRVVIFWGLALNKKIALFSLDKELLIKMLEEFDRGNIMPVSERISSILNFLNPVRHLYTIFIFPENLREFFSSYIKKLYSMADSGDKVALVKWMALRLWEGINWIAINVGSEVNVSIEVSIGMLSETNATGLITIFEDLRPLFEKCMVYWLTNIGESNITCALNIEGKDTVVYMNSLIYNKNIPQVISPDKISTRKTQYSDSPYVGRSLSEIEILLGEPKGKMRTAKGVLWIYEQFELLSHDGKFVSEVKWYDTDNKKER